MTVSSSASPRTFAKPVVAEPSDLLFGRAPRPVRCGLGLEIGAGAVYPEINFTLPPMLVTPDTFPRVREIYTGIIDGVLARARDLRLAGLMVEFEQLPPMTAEPAWGAELTELLKTRLQAAHDGWGLKGALRVTIVDLREEQRPPMRRSGPSWERMAQALEQAAARGADVLSIESTGGKEVHDPALTRADMAGIVFALGVLAPADMAWLWDRFVEVARRHRIVPGGDTACGFANTAMQLAGQKMLPDVLAAIVRALSAVRGLVAVERGAVGPLKDCGYENPVIKAITGVPIAMEGRSATCAHLSPIGNIAAAFADLWSNESVADVRLLSGPAPVASLESLTYDCRLMNAALSRGSARELRDLHVASDAPHSAQAALLTPEATLALARAITAERDPYSRTLAAGRTAFELIARAAADKALHLPPREQRWLDKLRTAFDALPTDPAALYGQIRPRYGELFDAKAYALLW
ncbi:MAG: methyltransferase MtaB domain-containing protein [Planctomycetota bacterium]